MPSTTFKDTQKGNGAYAGDYIWNTAANWTNGVPFNGEDVSATAAGSGTDFQADNIANLTLNSLSIAATATVSELLNVTGSLTLGSVSLNGGTGGKQAVLAANSVPAGAPASITVNGAISAAGTAILEAFGDGATVFDFAADPGAMQYWVGGANVSNGGLLYLQGAPAASSIFNFNGRGVFAFANSGASIAASLTGVGVGDALELPVTQVLSVTYGATSITVATSAGVYNFTNVGFVGGALNDFFATVDYTTGLDQIFLTSAPSVQGNAETTSGVYNNYYQWSNAANWSTGAVPVLEDVALGPATSGGLIDDFTTTSMNRLLFTRGGNELTVNGALTIGTLQFGVDGHDTLIASSQITGGAATATITVNNMVDTGGGDNTIAAEGVGASIVVNGEDAGALYEAFNGGKITLNVVPAGVNTGIFLQSGGTLVLTSPGFDADHVATLALQMGVTSGSTVELPGSVLMSNMSNDGHNPETIVTDFGTYVFTGWYETSGFGFNFGITDFVARRDGSSGLLKLTAEAAGAADNPQHNNDVNGDGFADIIFQNVSGETAVWNVQGVSLVNAAFLPNPGGTWALVATGDFTGDGKSDFLFQDATGAIAEWLMNGDSVASGLYLPNPGPTWKLDTTGDFNGDGRSDIALQGSDGSVAIWEMNGANIIANGAAVVADPGVAWKPIASGDFWGDGKTELVLQNSNGSLAFWGFNDSANGPVLDMTHTAQLSLDPGEAWTLKGAGDFNGDSISDLVFQNATTGQVAIWEMDQTGLLSPTSFTTLNGPGTGWAVAQIGDFINESMSDILFQNTATGELDTWFMNGLNLVSGHTGAANPGAAWHVIAG